MKILALILAAIAYTLYALPRRDYRPLSSRPPQKGIDTIAKRL